MSPSVPVGLYWLASRSPTPGRLAVIRLPEPIETLASTRGYLWAGALLIKPVAAGPGEVVCRHGAIVTINGLTVARARWADAAGRPLPRWSGCITLASDHVFVLSHAPDSFDGRYFGPIDPAHVLGTASALWADEVTGYQPHRQRGPP